jgi:hypothetical protein
MSDSRRGTQPRFIRLGGGVRGSVHRAWVSPFLPAVVAATPSLVMAVRLVLVHQDVVLAGDHAALDLSTLDATHGKAVLGPYSRFGFSHPGPAFFYLMAPVMLLTGRASWALYLGVQLLYAATCAALVAQVAIRSGRAAAACAALVVLGYFAVIRPDVLAVPWNPLAIVPVMALLLVATAAVQGPGGLAAVVVIGTFLLQTHLGTALVVAACAGVGVVLAVLGSRREARRSLRSTWRTLGTTLAATVAVLAWIPPAAQQLAHDPGNAGLLTRFFLVAHDGRPTARQAAAVVGRELDFTRRAIYLGGFFPTGREVRPLVVLALFGGAAAVLVALAHRRTNRFAGWLGVVSLGTALLAVYSVTGVVGGLPWYLMMWMSAPAVPLCLGYAVLAAERWRQLAAPALIATGFLALVMATGFLTGPLYRSPAFPEEPQARARVRAAWSLIDPELRRHGVRSVAFQAETEAPWPTIAGVSVRLERQGVHTAVSENMVHIFGEAHRTTGHEAMQVRFRELTAPPSPGARPLGVIDGLSADILGGPRP